MNLARLRRRAAWGLWVEDFARAVAPGCVVLAAYAILALFGLGSPWIFACALILFAASLWPGIARLRWPAPAAIDRRIERASGLRHRPLAMLEDIPENDSDMAAAIWKLHQRRIAASLQGARAGGLALGAARHDPFAVRGLLLLLLLAAAIIAGPDRLSRVAGALSLPRWPFAGPSVNAWITQPAYSGAPPLVLASGDHPMVLAGSRLTLVVDGKDQPRAALGDQAIRFGGSAQDGFRADADLRQSGKLQVGPWWHRLASWNITVVQPEKPVVHLTQLLPAAPLLLLRWNAQDRYGLVALNAAILPVGHPNALPETLSLALNSGNLQSAAGLAREDVSDSPYAGLQVQVVLSAANLAGVTAAAAPQTVRLPPPPLHDKTAAALADLRQRLALDPKARGPGQALQTLAQAPPTQISAAADVQMAMLARQISEHEISPEAAQQRMSTLGRQIEEGPDYEPAQALAAANQALEQALRQANNGRPLDNAKLQSLLAALHNRRRPWRFARLPRPERSARPSGRGRQD
jgi:hypothetical protein